MAAGRNCFIISFPYLFSIAAFVLTIFVIVGNLTSTGLLSKLYFMDLDFSDLSVTVDDTTVSASDLGLPDSYKVGLWNYCTTTDSNTTCSKTKGLFYFNPISIIEEAAGADITVPSAVSTALKSVKALSYAMSILFCLAAVFAIMEFISGFFAFHSRGGSFCSLIISVMSFVCSLASIGIATGMFAAESKAFSSSDLNISSSLNHTTLGLGWGAAVAALLASVFWFFSICVGSTRRTHAEKDIIYSPVENPSTVRY
ncbi:actin cortical patch SUR7/pH-response regulator pali [Myxozyma melibiosi]|uniref:Actin cortical patch SUR7/pH-response regulator pali n=1 Tax=Myxozyma melibiosi TaxID=54550 RepID=A0ABR1EYZ3_9ASCO